VRTSKLRCVGCLLIKYKEATAVIHRERQNACTVEYDFASV
jgi:hypothetical protein